METMDLLQSTKTEEDGDSAMQTGSTLKANSVCTQGLKRDQINVEEQKASTKTCQTMEELQTQNLNLLDEVDGIRAKLAALTAREVSFEKEETSQKLAVETLTARLQACKQELVRFDVAQGKWRDTERFLEVKVIEYEKQMNAKQGDHAERKSGEESETEEAMEPRCEQWDRVADENEDLQNVVQRLKQELRLSRSKEQYFEKERARFSARETEQKIQIQRLESRVSELSQTARENPPQSKPADTPCTRETGAQTDLTMQTIHDLEQEVEDTQDELDQVTHTLQSAGLKFNKDRAEWREQRQELEERATSSESKLTAAQESLEPSKEESTEDFSFNALQRKWEKVTTSATIDSQAKLLKSYISKEQDFEKERERFRAREMGLEAKITLLECQRKQGQELEEGATYSQSMESMQNELEVMQESMMEQLERYNAMEDKVLALEQERDSLKKTVELLEEESADDFSFNALQRKWEKASETDDSQAEQRVKSDRSKEQDFEKEREGFRAREMELEERIQLLESQVTELCETAWGNILQNKKQQNLEEGATDSESMQNELQEPQETLMEHLQRYDAMEEKIIALEQERDSLEKTVELLKEELRSNRSKEQDFDKEMERFSEREEELEDQIKLLESQVAELRETAPEDCSQRETVDKPCTREMEVQTDFTLQTIKDMEQEVEDVQEEFDHLVQSLRREELKFNKDRAEWREQCQELEERATSSESKLTAAQESLAEREKALEKARKQWSLEKEKSMQRECDELKEVQESLKGYMERYHGMEQKILVLEAEQKEFERRAVEAEAQLGKALVDAVRKEKAFQEERDTFREMEKHMRDLKKDNADLKTTVEDLKGHRRKLEENVHALETSGANEALVSELRRQLQNEVTLREALHRFQWEREKDLMAQQERLQHEKEQWVKRESELSAEKTRIFAVFEDEREKTKRLEKKAEEAAMKREQTMQEFEDELRRRDQEKVETERHYEQELERLRQRVNEDLGVISDLKETLEQLETKQKEAHEKNKEHTLREEQWKEVKEKLLSQIELLRATISFNQRKKERKGFFSRVFGRSN